MITVRVGSGATAAVFVVPEKAIRASSDFVDTAMKGSGHERIVLLPEFDHETFGVYLQWLLTGKLHSKQRLQDYGDELGYVMEHVIARSIEFSMLVRLSSVGHYLLDTGFRDTINDAIVHWNIESRWCTTDDGFEVYRKIPAGSPTRQLIVDLITRTADLDDYLSMSKHNSMYHPDLALDLLHALASRLLSETPRKSPLWDWKKSCKYHCHGDEKPCYRKKLEMYVVTPASSSELPD
jgi:hypothetical protein